MVYFLFRVEEDLVPSTSGLWEMGGVVMIPVPPTAMLLVSIRLLLAPSISGVKEHPMTRPAVLEWQ